MKPPSANSTSYSVGGDFLALLNTEKFLKIFEHVHIYLACPLATCPPLIGSEDFADFEELPGETQRPGKL